MCIYLVLLIHITLGALIHIIRYLLCVETLLLHIMCIYLALDTHYSRRVDTHYSTSVMCRDYFATHYVYLSRADTPYSRRVDTHYSISIMCRDYHILCVSISRLIHITLGALIHIIRHLLCVETILLHIMCIYLALDTHYSITQISFAKEPFKRDYILQKRYLLRLWGGYA